MPDEAVSMQHCTHAKSGQPLVLPIIKYIWVWSGLTPEKMLNFPPAAPQIPSELSRFLKSDDWQKKLVPGSFGGVGVAVTVSDDCFGSVGVCLCFWFLL